MAHVLHPQNTPMPSGTPLPRPHRDQRQQGQPLSDAEKQAEQQALHLYQLTQQQQQQQPQQLQQQLQQQCRDHQTNAGVAEGAAPEMPPASVGASAR